MSIIAILSALSLSAMYRSRNQVFIQHASERLKADIRTQFINAISIKSHFDPDPSRDCTSLKSPKLRTLRINLNESNFNSYEFVDYCEGSTTAIGDRPFESKTVDISRDLGFRKPASITLTDLSAQIVSDPSDLSNPPGGYLHLVFASPYGKFYATKSESPVLDPSLWSYDGYLWSSDGTSDSVVSSDGTLVRTGPFNISLSIVGGSNPPESSFSLTKDGNIDE